MLNKRRVNELESRIGAVEKENGRLERNLGIDLQDFGKEIRNELRQMLREHKNEVEARLIEFHKEITDKFFGTIERIFRWNKEITLVERLAGNIGKEDFDKLRTALLEPVIKARQDAEGKAETTKITNHVESKGEAIRKLRQETHDKFIKAQRTEQPTDFFKGQLDVLDKIIGGSK